MYAQRLKTHPSTPATATKYMPSVKSHPLHEGNRRGNAIERRHLAQPWASPSTQKREKLTLEEVKRDS